MKKLDETSQLRKFEETGHRIIDTKAEAKIGAWPAVDSVTELVRENDFRFGLPGNGGHECLQTAQADKMTYEDLLEFYHFILDDRKMEIDNDMKQILEEAGLPSTDLPQRTLDALWEANKYTDREDELDRELDEFFGLRKPGDDDCVDYERRVRQIEFLQAMMASTQVDFAVSENVPALKQDLQMIFGDNNQTGKVQSVITVEFFQIYEQIHF